MSTSNGLLERVVVYVGPTLERDEVFRRVPHAIVRPPAKQGDIVSDLHRLEPTHVLLIDGEFHQNLSVWHKELVYALMYPGVQGVYGAASMGALRAADLADVGMIGCGKIFWWYYEGVIEDDAEVAVSYAKDKEGNYRSTVPLANLRASHVTQRRFEQAREIPWHARWKAPHRIDQKRLDAIELLETFRSLKPLTDGRPSPRHLSMLFRAQHERDRRIDVDDVEVPLQAIDGLVALQDPHRHQTFSDASNRALALVLADVLNVLPTADQVKDEGTRHCLRFGLTEPGSLGAWMAENGLNATDFERLMFQNARVTRMREALLATRNFQRSTQDVLDYLRTHNAFAPWAKRAAAAHAQGDEPETGYLAQNASAEWEWHRRNGARGIATAETFAEFLWEYGFASTDEFRVALSRDPLPE